MRFGSWLQSQHDSEHWIADFRSCLQPQRDSEHCTSSKMRRLDAPEGSGASADLCHANAMLCCVAPFKIAILSRVC